ncbi:hypothetical protein FHR54_003312 [Xanthomonas arboricola]
MRDDESLHRRVGCFFKNEGITSLIAFGKLYAPTTVEGAAPSPLAACPAMVAGKGPAAKAQMIRSAPDLSVASNQIATPASCLSRSLGDLHVWSRARRPHRSRDTPSTRPWGLGGGIHAANGPAIGQGTAPDSWLVVLLKSKDTALQLASRC